MLGTRGRFFAGAVAVTGMEFDGGSTASDRVNPWHIKLGKTKHVLSAGQKDIWN